VASNDETLLTADITGGAEVRIVHPPGTFALTPASLITLRAVGRHQHLLTGVGMDWGTGTGCLAVVAAQLPRVQKVIGLDISAANVATAWLNAQNNGVSDKVAFLVSDSYVPLAPEDRATLDTFAGRVNFLLANPPSSEGDDGFGYRRLVLQGARMFLVPGGVVFLSVSYQYGRRRLERLCEEAPGFTYGGELASTDWVPFYLGRPDLLHCLHQYAAEESRGGLEYTFKAPDGPGDRFLTAQTALAHFQRTGQSPLSKWQTHRFEYRPA
jgi:SAM-dependent methyltransferase